MYQKSKIIHAERFKDVLKHLSYNTELVVDLDYVIMLAQHELGSDFWFEELVQHAKHQLKGRDDYMKPVLHVYNAVQHLVRMKPVEQHTAKIINALQDIGINVTALTARGLELSKSTHRQLRDIGIDLTDRIIFCNGKDKGTCYKSHLEYHGRLSSKHPRHVLFVDDKLSNCQSMERQLTELSIPHTIICYGAVTKDLELIKSESQRHETFRFHSKVQLHLIRDELPEPAEQAVKELALLPECFEKKHLEKFRFFRKTACFEEPLRGKAYQQHLK